MSTSFITKSLVFAMLLSAISYSFAQRRVRHSKPEIENTLSGTRWKVDGVPFADKDRTEYSLATYDELSYESQMGHFISFEENTFTSDYNAPCGMDCFTNVSGAYWFKTAELVHIKVIKIDRHGYCDKGSESLNRDMGYFELVKVEKGWKLVKAS